MARLMEVAHTAHLVRSRTKTVTRRAGWRMLKAGDQLTLCPRVRGRRPGEALERIVTVDVVAVTRERLGAITAADVAAEGFPEWTAEQFVEFFCVTHKGVTADDQVTRIEWRYPRICRGCGCTEGAACDTLTGPCAWAVTFDDNTGVCTACPTTLRRAAPAGAAP
ncbi:hypothetical protein [Mycobacterium avium]|uniref:ASCH domain-containing protein n=1 Tax=Mycobacterium avium subsp. hominissuis TaxID=439334 RepID=A0AAI8ST12_MYCAV|nr:hypothetical protein [Mycobacterium avium]PBA08627.1 hypothetical protein CKJ70_25200 [Mycobacterium avium]BBN50845.1 hypothetical protein JPH1_53200 [Mycobacterium avium subsp. hominissuis]